MSRKELIILWIGIGVVILICLVPPWESRSIRWSSHLAGYHPIFWSMYDDRAHSYSIGLKQLFVQCFVAGALTWACMRSARARKP
jgi:hypothetical protein